MSCDIKYNDICFSIQKVSRITKEHYVFIGNIEGNILNILKKLENRNKILKEEIILLKKNFKDDYMDWINIVKNNIKINFIPNKIYIDDSINEIRKKIFAYCSNPDKKNYILPENQELWIIKNNGQKEIIGYYYENSKSKQKDILEPHIIKDFVKNNLLNFDDDDRKKNTSENSMLVYDLFEDFNIKHKVIYFSDAKDEEIFLKNKGIIINENIINKYFKKYWPYINLSYNIEEVKNNYFLLNDYYYKENYIFDLINNIEINSNIFGSCNILNSVLAVDKNIYNTNENDKYIDLFPVFDYLRENRINNNTPFIKYSDETLEYPFSIISKEAIDESKISKKLLLDWIGINIDESERKKNGIIIKRFLREYNNKPIYSTIIINKKGNLEIKTSFESNFNANFNDIENTIKDSKKFIEDINKNRLTKKRDEIEKIETPDVEFNDGKVTFKNNTKITFMNIIIPLKLSKSLDFKKLAEFSKKFPYFLSEFPKDTLKKNNIEKTETSIKFKYKRVSGFANMNDILLDIDILKQKHDKEPSFIIKSLEKKYQKSVDELKGYLLEWEKKYSSSKTLKVASQYKTGILVNITNSNILIYGITQIYQISLVYKFFVTFLNLFINYDNLIKDKTFKQIFQSKNINSIDYENSYEINENVKLDLDQIYDLEYNSEEDYLLDEEYNILNKIYNEPEEIETLNYHKGIIGLANDSEIDPNIRLTCDDPIPEKDTCEDFCNDEKYFLRRLQRYDNKLFKPKTSKKDSFSQYSKGCQQSYRQPIVLPYDPETNTHIKRDSYSYSIKYSSEPEVFNRWYICPKIWCPYCEIPISQSEIDPKTIRTRTTKGDGGKCTVAVCPNGNHQVFIRENDKKVFTFPGFLTKAHHPQGLCMPCCFLLSQDNPKSGSYQAFKKCIGDDIENTGVKEGQIYILGKGVPIEKDRYGRLPIEIARILKTNLETGYLGYKSGYLRKGIKQDKNNYFLNAICDILSCDKNNISINVTKIKHLLIEKLDINLFNSLHSGNLPNIFYNPKEQYTSFENFKNYILNQNSNHIYLWDLLQRNNILFEKGVNIFIFENNNLLCPKGENIKYFYDTSKKSILLLKMKENYEPIYFLEGDGKGALTTCVFDYKNEEIKKLFEISFNGCTNKYNIDWISLLKDNIKKYDLNIDNLVIDNGDDLQTTLNELLINIKNKKLDNGFLPNTQYIDSYNKVFALKLNNGLYLPISPSKLIEKIKYLYINNINDIDKISFNDTIKFTNIIVKKTNLKCNITHKILDLKFKKYIIALVNQNNRFIPIKETINSDKKLKISNLNYYSDLDESLVNKIKKPDLRVEIINKKNFEDETYIRMKFELSKFLQIKENSKYMDTIINIINSDDKNIIKNREKIYNILKKIFSELVLIKNVNIDYNDYVTPNKRMPCFLRNKKNKNNIQFSCESDPHCINVNNSCKLFINEKNLLDSRQKINNYEFYLAKIVDEILRFKLKRNEILNDNIPIIINKELIQENPNKYIIIHTNNFVEINNIINNLFDSNNGVFIDSRNLYEEINTKEIAFKKDKYLKSNFSLIQNNKVEELSVFWSKLLKNNYKVKLDEINNNVYSIIKFILNLDELKNNNYNTITTSIIKNKIINYFRNIIMKKNNNILDNIIKLYKYDGTKIFKYITSINSLIEEILNDSYYGSEADLEYISKIFNINIFVLDKRIKKNNKGLKIYESNNKNYTILLYKSVVFENINYNIIQQKNKILVKINELPQKFIEYAYN